MNRPSIPTALRLGALCSLLAATSAASAADGLGTLDQRVWIRLAAFQPSIDTTARIDDSTDSSIGTSFSFEELGLPDKKTLPSLLVGARFGAGWRAEFEYFQLRRSGQFVLDRELNVDDTTFPVQAELDTRLNSDIYRLSGGYSFIHTPQAEVGVVLGLHVTRFDLQMRGTLSSPGQPTATTSAAERQTVPLPTFGIFGALALAPGWQATARVDVFQLKSGDYEGRLINAQANVIYRFTPNAGLGIGYRLDDYRVEAEKSEFRGEVEYKFRGPQAFVELSF